MDKVDLFLLGRGIKLIVCDLDGTLLNSEKQISPASLRAAELARERGIATTICSGRVPSMLYAYSRRLGVDGPLAAGNGAVIFDARDGKVLCQNTIDPDVALPLLRFCERNNMDYSLLGARGGFFSLNSVRIRRFEQYNRIAAADGLPPAELSFFGEDYTEALRGDIYKVLIYELGEGQQKMARDFLQKHCPKLDYTSSEEGLLDISACGVSKGWVVCAE